MNLAKLSLIVLMLIATGLVILPNTVSLFAGEHYWYNLANSSSYWESDVPCKKCHADIYEEMRAHIGPHTGETGYGPMKCSDCHRVRLYTYQLGAVGTSYTNVQVGKLAHAASVVRCMDCHKWVNATEFNTYVFGGFHWNGLTASDCSRCHGSTFSPVPVAGGFGLTNYTGDTGSCAAHMAFVKEAMKNSTLRGANEACIACHTAVPVKINWTHARSLEFEVGLGNPVNTSYGPHNWTVTNWKVNGTAWVIVYGNTTGSGATNPANITWPGTVPGTSYK